MNAVFTPFNRERDAFMAPCIPVVLKMRPFISEKIGELLFAK